MEEYRTRSFANTFKKLPIFMDSDSDKDSPASDVRIITSNGLCILAHSHVLVSVSTVFESVLNRTAENEDSLKEIKIHGVPCEAVVSFIRFLYSNKCTEEEMEKYGIHLLALSHVYAVHHLKQRCTKGLGLWLVLENVLDVLQLARLCDAPDLLLNCMKMVASNFKEVQMTDGWTFVQDHDPWLELEILHFLDEAESRKKKSKKNKEERSLYMELNEAMECLQHICTDGCTSVGPNDIEPHPHKEPCENFSTCQRIQLLIKHFATCKNRVRGDCCKCKRTWQLFRLHAEICDETVFCKVPLCKQFKMKMRVGRKEEYGKWRLLARKVASAKAVCSLSCPAKK